MLSALNWRIFWRGQTLKIEKVVGFSFEELQNTQKNLVKLKCCQLYWIKLNWDSKTRKKLPKYNRLLYFYNERERERIAKIPIVN